MNWISLLIGSMAGGVARYAATGAVHRVLGLNFPYGTLVVNVVGCFLIGVLDGVTEFRSGLSPNARLLLMTGFCGAFTTFSTFILETFRLMEAGEVLRAAANISISVAAGYLFFSFGLFISRAF